MILQDLSTATAPDAVLPVALALEEEAVGVAGFVGQLLQLIEHPAMPFPGFRVHWTRAFIRTPVGARDSDLLLPRTRRQRPRRGKPVDVSALLAALRSAAACSAALASSRSRRHSAALSNVTRVRLPSRISRGPLRCFLNLK